MGSHLAGVLILDHDPRIGDKLSRILRSAGYAVWSATSSEEGIAIAHREPIDLVVCDVHLEGDTGYDACRTMHGAPGGGELTFLFTSGSQAPDIIRRSSELGASYHVRKPIDEDLFVKLISRALWIPLSEPVPQPIAPGVLDPRPIRPPTASPRPSDQPQEVGRHFQFCDAPASGALRPSSERGQWAESLVIR